MFWKPAIKKKSVKFFINNITGDWWPAITGTSDITPTGLISNLETIPDIFTVTDYATALGQSGFPRSLRAPLKAQVR